MITIIGYNKNRSNFLVKFLEKNSIPHKFSLIENAICCSEKIILPDTNNIVTAIKKMSLHNLNNYLQLVQKPILGINNGLRIMCNNILDIDRNGLGFFNLDVKSISDDFKSEDIGELNLNSTDIAINKKNVNFDSSKHLCKTEYAKDSFTLDNKEYSLVLNNKNYFGLELDIKKNLRIAENILKQFVNL
ncbi:MAG: hypothetical protein CR986_07330 [Ignavibacteriae bacterium]|nr:MAG: hypothetical protein CR986_07330 [Ignavibacteriota bacterium]